ncbi:Very-long-chain (3R)-3-hydroxyacyl-CoA dehydratase 1 [Willisornis vidua]|uniref:Very-long-chain (3R)-3-hydroxyacyl-CoA dehydratase n=1 Tax=Willisornis vidua TaxID=1566151 RepID=A0ABQ9CSV7_9PASS|nr:Very-long-chain (3R)-3-hydroxyacyl-CoA dehydratase 1 [Willisornis vidua]
MASSEEEGAGNGAAEEKENGKKRKLGALATAWLIFYNVAMTAGGGVALEPVPKESMVSPSLEVSKARLDGALSNLVYGKVSLPKAGSPLCSWKTNSKIDDIPKENTYIPECSFDSWSYKMKFMCLFPGEYNFFIILYPAGVAGELLTIYAALPYVKKTGMFSLRLPNKYNVSFDYYYFLIIVMLSYVPLFPQLYFHMLRQRRRVLHGEVIVEKDD